LYPKGNSSYGNQKGWNCGLPQTESLIKFSKILLNILSIVGQEAAIEGQRKFGN
jgi:hypothetical protein